MYVGNILYYLLDACRALSDIPCLFLVWIICVSFFVILTKDLSINFFLKNQHLTSLMFSIFFLFSNSLISFQLFPSSACGGGSLVAKLCLTLVTPWTVACQTPLSMGFSKQEYWSGLSFPFPGISRSRDQNCISCISCIGRHTTVPSGKPQSTLCMLH